MAQVCVANWPEEADDLRAVRERVFVDELSVPLAVERDGQDEDAVHAIARGDDGAPLGAVRLLGTGQIGRLAVLPGHRDQGLGRALLDFAIAAARSAGHRRVFLHAQLAARRFYERAGFVAEGEPFEEAGIGHVTMIRELPIEFRKSGRDDLRIVKEAEGPTFAGAAAATARLEDCSDALRVIDSPVVAREALLELVTHARQELVIYSQELDPMLFDNEQLAAQVSRVARLHARNRIRILVHQSQRARECAHRLLALHRRLPSKLQLRLAHEELRDADATYVVADGRGVLVLPRYTEYRGFAYMNNAVLARQRLEEFGYLWSRGGADPDLRTLSV